MRFARVPYLSEGTRFGEVAQTAVAGPVESMYRGSGALLLPGLASNVLRLGSTGFQCVRQVLLNVSTSVENVLGLFSILCLQVYSLDDMLVVCRKVDNANGPSPDAKLALFL